MLDPRLPNYSRHDYFIAEEIYLYLCCGHPQKTTRPGSLNLPVSWFLGIAVNGRVSPEVCRLS